MLSWIVWLDKTGERPVDWLDKLRNKLSHDLCSLYGSASHAFCRSSMYTLDVLARNLYVKRCAVVACCGLLTIVWNKRELREFKGVLTSQTLRVACAAVTEIQNQAIPDIQYFCKPLKFLSDRLFDHVIP